jgi:hypothetical protein
VRLDKLEALAIAYGYPFFSATISGNVYTTPCRHADSRDSIRDAIDATPEPRKGKRR